MSRKTIGRRDESGGLNYFERNFSSKALQSSSFSPFQRHCRAGHSLKFASFSSFFESNHIFTM